MTERTKQNTIEQNEVKYSELMADAISKAFIKSIKNNEDIEVIKMFYERNKENIYFDVLETEFVAGNNYPIMEYIVEHPQARELLPYLMKCYKEFLSLADQRVGKRVKGACTLATLVDSCVDDDYNRAVHQAIIEMLEKTNHGIEKEVERVKWLMDLGADICAENRDGALPAWLLIEKDYAFNAIDSEQANELLKVMIEKSPEILTYVNKSGETFFDYVNYKLRMLRKIAGYEAIHMVTIALELGIDPTVENGNKVSFADTYKEGFFNDKSLGTIQNIHSLMNKILEQKKAERLFGQAIAIDCNLSI